MDNVAFARTVAHLTALARAGPTRPRLDHPHGRLRGRHRDKSRPFCPRPPHSLPVFSRATAACSKLTILAALHSQPLDYGGSGIVDSTSQLHAKDACSIPTAAQQQQLGSSATRLLGSSAPRLLGSSAHLAKHWRIFSSPSRLRAGEARRARAHARDHFIQHSNASSARPFAATCSLSSTRRRSSAVARPHR